MKLGIEIHGCVWHACKKHFPDDEFIMPSGLTAGKVRERDEIRLNFIKTQVPNLKIYWECEIAEMMQNDKEMRSKFDSYLDEGPLSVRSCYFGGRTEAFKLFHKAGPN